MVNKCWIVNCNSNYVSGTKRSTASFPSDGYLKQKWITFVNRKEWNPTKYSVICLEHFEEKYIKVWQKKKL